MSHSREFRLRQHPQPSHNDAAADDDDEYEERKRRRTVQAMASPHRAFSPQRVWNVLHLYTDLLAEINKLEMRGKA